MLQGGGVAWCSGGDGRHHRSPRPARDRAGDSLGG